MARQGYPPIAAPSTIPLPTGGSVCVNFYMRSNVNLVSNSYQIRMTTTTSPGVSINCGSASVNVSEPRWAGYNFTPIIDISQCPPTFRAGSLTFGGESLVANTIYYVGEVCYAATLAASGISPITFDTGPGQTFVTNSSDQDVPIANAFAGSLEVFDPSIPAASTWGLVAMMLSISCAGTAVLHRRPILTRVSA